LYGKTERRPSVRSFFSLGAMSPLSAAAGGAASNQSNSIQFNSAMLLLRLAALALPAVVVMVQHDEAPNESVEKEYLFFLRSLLWCALACFTVRCLRFSVLASMNPPQFQASAEEQPSSLSFFPQRRTRALLPPALRLRQSPSIELLRLIDSPFDRKREIGKVRQRQQWEQLKKQGESHKQQEEEEEEKGIELVSHDTPCVTGVIVQRFSHRPSPVGVEENISNSIPIRFIGRNTSIDCNLSMGRNSSSIGRTISRDSVIDIFDDHDKTFDEPLGLCKWGTLHDAQLGANGIGGGSSSIDLRYMARTPSPHRSQELIKKQRGRAAKRMGRRAAELAPGISV
jgi:hypothetical protein